jgi:hypothetical protein
MVAKLLRPAAVALVALAVLVYGGTVAHAAYPGQNGRIAIADGQGFRSDVVTMNYDGSGKTTLGNDSVNVFDPAWSPDGTKIAVTGPGGPESRENIWIMNADGSGMQQVTSIFGQDRHPTWSPDGTRIAFQTNWDGNSEIYVVNADGSGLQNLTNNVENHDTTPAWSPDGTEIAYVARTTNHSPNPAYVHVMNADGTGQTALPVTLGGADPQWSPDGSKIAYTERNTCNPSCPIRIHTINPDGSGDQVVTSGEWFRPHWSPDGTKFVVQGGQAIATMNVDGTGLVVISPNPGWGQERPDWQPVSATGYPRPAGASPLRVSLVPGYKECLVTGNFNRTHGPPLEHVSCNPPRQQSAVLTVGTPDANGYPTVSEGFVKLAAVAGSPGTPGDQADVNITASITDVRCRNFAAGCTAGPGTDYEGSVLFDVALRITDKLNGPSQDLSGTLQDTSLRVPFTCVATGSASGSTCSLSTSADAVVPGLVPEGARTVWQPGQIAIQDAGPNGTGYANCPPTCGDGDEATFLRQGVFVP